MAEQRKAPAKKKAETPDNAELIAAINSEANIEVEARKIWEQEGNPEYLTPKLLHALTPILRSPIPGAFITTEPPVKGKPYESTGIRSVQVQIDRMNNVLGVGNWRDAFSYQDDGRLCHVVVSILGEVFEGERTVLAMRSSYGGVDHGSSRGNIYKGSYTNAAKLAFARLGPGHEVYVGNADLDPDVSAEAAKLSGEITPEKPKAKQVDEQSVANLRKLWKESGVDEKAWKTFLASRKKKDVTEFNTDDYEAAVGFLAANKEDS